MTKRFLKGMVMGSALVLAILLLSRLDLEAMLKSFGYIQPNQLIFLCGLQLLTLLLIAYQWKDLAHHMETHIPFSKMLFILMYGTFVESITPSVKAGGEATKVVLLQGRSGMTFGQATALVGLQKMLSSTVFACLSIVSVLYYFMSVSEANGLGTFLIIGLLLSVLTATLLLVLIIWPEKVLAKVYKLHMLKTKKETIDDFTGQFKTAVSHFSKDKKNLMKHVCIAFAIWLLFPLKVYLTMQAFGIQIHFLTAAAITYLTYMVGMIPLLPGGLGSFEAAMVILLTPFSIVPHLGLAIALVVRFITFWFVFILTIPVVIWDQMTLKKHRSSH